MAPWHKTMTSLAVFPLLALLLLQPLGSEAEDGAGQPRVEPGVEAGVLACDSLPETRVSLVVFSSVEIVCTFESLDGKVEQYRGDTGIGLGLDVNWKRSERIYFSVLAGSRDISAGSHSLTGHYVGGKASVTAGRGLGAAALIGGSSDNIALQPVGLEESSGFGLSGGLAYLRLEPDRPQQAGR